MEELTVQTPLVIILAVAAQGTPTPNVVAEVRRDSFKSNSSPGRIRLDKATQRAFSLLVTL